MEMGSLTCSCLSASDEASFSVHITHVGLHDFRNYEDWVLTPDSPLTVLCGPNAVGKTNVVEAIQIVATGASFRRPIWDETIRWGADAASISMVAEGDGSFAEVEVRIKRDGAREWRVGGVPRRRMADTCRFVPVVTFTPDDLLLAKGAAEHRRSTLDTLGEQLSTTYGALRRDYTRAVRHRNAVLRDGGADGELGPWDEQIVKLGARLHTHRRGLAARVRHAMMPAYSHLSGGESLDLHVSDRCGVSNPDPSTELSLSAIEGALKDELVRRASEERARGVSLVGPHRDDITFMVDGRDARTYGSQGQQRTIALAWKLAEVAVIKEVLRRSPILLLDDVMSELDDSRRAALTGLVQQDTQTFVTTTTTTYFEPALLSDARVIQLGGAG